MVRSGIDLLDRLGGCGLGRHSPLDVPFSGTSLLMRISIVATQLVKPSPSRRTRRYDAC